jgi:hypothetical protein
MRGTQAAASAAAAAVAPLVHRGIDATVTSMTSAPESTPATDEPNPRVQQVLDAVEAAAVTPEDALRISLELLGFVEEYHLETLEELLGDAEADAISVAVWAADSARLKTAREVLEEVLGDDEDEEGEDLDFGDEAEDA